MYYKTVGKSCLQVICLLTSLLGTVPTGSQTPLANPHAQDIKLTVKVLTQDYCIGDERTRSLVLRLRMQLVNGSDVPIMVYTPLSGVTIVSHTLADAVAGRHEIEMHPPDVPIRAPKASAESSSQRRVMKSRESLELSSDPIQLFIRDHSKSDLVSLTPGIHYLQFQIDVFPPDANVSNLISVVKRVVSDPIPINIPANSTVIPGCPALFKSMKPKGA
jgi:hypothetical protein